MTGSSRTIRANRATRAAIYCRVSTAAQEDNSSLDTQEERCRDHASAQGWNVVDVFKEVHTGSELFERPALGRLREMARNGQVDVVLALALDRISRNQAHLGFLLSEWDHLGIRVELVTEELDDTPEGRLLQSVRGFVAEVERLKIIERTKRGMQARVAAGRPIPGRAAPFGLRWRDDKKSGYEVDPDKIAIVLRIFDAVLSGQTLRSVANGLTGEGIPTPSGRGKRWDVSTLHCVLTNPVYTGRAVAYRTRIERRKGKSRVVYLPETDWVALPDGIAPTVVTEAEFAAVRARLEYNRSTAPRNNADPTATLLRCGIARCGYCGYPLSITKRDRRAHMYRCHPVGRDRHGCPSFGVMAPILDQAVWQRVEEVLRRPAIIAAEVARRLDADPYAADLAALDRRLSSLATQRARLAKAVAMMDDEEATAPILAELQTLAREAKVLEAERTSLVDKAGRQEEDRERLADLAFWCERVAGNLPTLTYDEKRMVLDALGVEVKVYRADHDPRWEITMAPAPIEDPGSSHIVFSKGTPSSTVIPPSTPKPSTA